MILLYKEKICNFENFVKSFSSILKLKENNVLKYKFIISLFRFGEEDINVKHINIFLQLIRGKMMFEGNTYDELNNNLIKRYDRIYSNEIGMNFKFGNILTCLESFFDKNEIHY
jgi:CRISPR/Cas system endoribonuclease Cas6 (RAMP superfamily)